MRIDEAVACFKAALRLDPEAIGAHLGLYEALQVRGDRRGALEHQGRALARQRLFREKTAAPGAPTVLMLSIPGDWQANTPLEFLYGQMPFGVMKLYTSPQLPEPRMLPAADVVFNAVAHSEAAELTLAALARWLPALHLPVINDPARVARLSRHQVARDFATMRGALVPAVHRVSRTALREDRLVLDACPATPALIRPVDSQAGNDLCRLERPADLDDYLAGVDASAFFIAPFIDYRSADGLYRKYRVIFVAGVPYPYHLAISDKWMVHYYNARNGDDAAIRSEEERWLADISFAFDDSRGEVLSDIARRVDLDYFGIDCGILPDGRVVLFEIDVAMLVHNGDPADTYAYKHAYVSRIYRAVERMIEARARAGRR
ncbi:MAG: hypothetical protein JO101_07495 [Candidatus Eremiobacteraeota bacterium]|nr:hypothetical protein [Candidatus Eremiobacteraeota bacterium]